MMNRRSLFGAVTGLLAAAVLPATAIAKRVFYVDVGDLPRDEAISYLDEVKMNLDTTLTHERNSNRDVILHFWMASRTRGFKTPWCPAGFMPYVVQELNGDRGWRSVTWDEITSGKLDHLVFTGQTQDFTDKIMFPVFAVRRNYVRV